MNPFFKLQCTALAAAALMPFLAQAAVGSGDLYTASATLGSITYRLVDLTPDDGQTPWIQINQGAGSGGQGGAFIPNGHETVGYYQNYPAPAAYTSGQFPAQAMSAQSADGMAIAGASPQGLQLGIRASADDWNRYAATYPHLGNQSAAQAGDFAAYSRANRDEAYTYTFNPLTEKVLLKAFDPGATHDFTVSANTMVIVEATMGYQAEIDHAAIAALSTNPLGLDVSISANSTLMLAWSQPLVDLNNSTWDSYQDARDAILAANPYDYGESRQLKIEGSGQKLVSASFRNTGSTALQGSLAMNLELYGAIFVPDAPSTGGGGVPSIPEPGTYALMGLGLVGLTWARRRHQAC